jgi:hypothetical protein
MTEYELVALMYGFVEERRDPPSCAEDQGRLRRWVVEKVCSQLVMNTRPV